MKQVVPFLLLLSITCFAFSQDMDAGRDTVICAGNYVHLNTLSNDDIYYYYRWRPAYNLSDSTRPAPWVWPDSTTTYYFYAFRPDSNNLVFNGDFSQGNTGFTSQYSYRAPNGNRTLWNEGTYSVSNNGLSVHENFSNHYDHTVGTINGSFLIVNATGVANTVVWSQTLNNILPNTDYVFYAWATSVNEENPAILQFSINGALLDQPFPLSGQFVWDQFYTLWNSGSSTTATITIVNQNVILSGNDFGVDDIFFAPIYPDIDSVTVSIKDPDSTMTVIEQCANSSYVFNGRKIIVESGMYVDTLKTELGCDSVTWLDIKFYPEVEVDLGENQLHCMSDTTFIVLDPGAEYYSYLWSTGDTSSSLRVTISGIYSLTVANEIGCEAEASVEIIFVDTPATKIISNTLDFCEEYKMTLSIETDAPNIIWSTGDITPEIEVYEFGKYYVTASEYHCSYVDTFEVVFCCPREPYLPNAITPSDHNDINDFFQFSKILPFESIELYIFDRWGRRVFYTTSPEFQWGGTVNGKLVTGLYYYVLEFEDGCTFHGSITVL